MKEVKKKRKKKKEKEKRELLRKSQNLNLIPRLLFTKGCSRDRSAFTRNIQGCFLFEK